MCAAGQAARVGFLLKDVDVQVDPWGETDFTCEKLCEWDFRRAVYEISCVRFERVVWWLY